MSQDISELTEQVKSLRDDIKSIVTKTKLTMWQESGLLTRLKSLSTDLSDFRKEFSGFRKETKENFGLVGRNLVKQESQIDKLKTKLESFETLKDNLFTKIDKSYATPLKRQQQETDALNSRTIKHHDAINKINVKIGLPAMA